MKTIPAVVEEYISQQPYLHSFLNEGIINVSSLARKILPYAEKETGKEVKIGSIIMAINRYESEVQGSLTIKKDLKDFNDYHIKNKIELLTFKNSPTLSQSKQQMLTKIENKDLFHLWIQGSKECNIILESKHTAEITQHFKNEDLIFHKGDLSLVNLEIPQYAQNAIGVFYVIFEKLSLSNINVIEIVSTPNELSILVENHTIDKLFNTLFTL